MKYFNYAKMSLGLLISFLLFGCTQQLEVNESIINDAFDNLSINVDLMIANDRIDNDDDPHYDLTEMVDAIDKDAIYIFTSLFDENESISEEKIIYITAEYIYIYMNDDMSRDDNPYDVNEEDYYQDILTAYTTLFDLESFSVQTYNDLALALIHPSLTRRGSQYTLKGISEPPLPIADDETFESEFIYTETQLVQVSQSHRHDYASTWQKSNFIAGIDYFFGTATIPEFPPLSEFGY